MKPLHALLAAAALGGAALAAPALLRRAGPYPEPGPYEGLGRGPLEFLEPLATDGGEFDLVVPKGWTREKAPPPAGLLRLSKGGMSISLDARARAGDDLDSIDAALQAQAREWESRGFRMMPGLRRMESHKGIPFYYRQGEGPGGLVTFGRLKPAGAAADYELSVLGLADESSRGVVRALRARR